MSGSPDGPPHFSYSEFVPVRSKKKRRRQTKTGKIPFADSFRHIREELTKDDWFAQSQYLIERALKSCSSDVVEVLCLGLGSPTVSHNASVQLAFLLETCDRFGIEPNKVHLYDPVFNSEDRSLFKDLHLKVLADISSAKYVLDLRTICFMPHCDMELYENLLSSNWSHKHLSNMILLGNRLEEYVDSNPRHKLEHRVPCLLRVVSVLECQALPPSTNWPTAFNNTCIQFIDNPSQLIPEWFSEAPQLDPESPHSNELEDSKSRDKVETSR